ncbi:MAG: BamA/TamA family outer membrane protein [Spirochaetales bacterium]|nr:BamA/TamA family outer membrane protein [Spirochaetales bacterium]
MVMYPVNKSDTVSPLSTSMGFLLWSKPDWEIDDSTIIGGLYQKFHLAEDTWRVSLYGAGARVLYRYYRPGNTPGDNIDVWAYSRGFYAGTRVDYRTWKDLFTGLGYDFQIYDIYGRDRLAQLFLDLAGVPRGTQYNSSISGYASWDTRDSQFGPESGILANLQGVYADNWLGSSTCYGQIIADYSQYRGFGNSVQQILAWNVKTQTGLGDVPENQLSSLGARGGIRGYMSGEFKDKSTLESQVEYRVFPVERFGVAGFFGLGTAFGYTPITEATVFPAGGFGFRIAMIPEQRVNARLDLAWGIDSFSIYFALGESF